MREIQAVRRGIRKSSLLAAAAVLCGAPLSVRLFAQGSDAAWRVDAAPSTMVLSELKHGAGRTVFVLENVSGKHITAFSLSHGEVTHTTDYFTGNDLAPNAYDELVIGDEELQSAAEHVLRLSAVVHRWNDCRRAGPDRLHCRRAAGQGDGDGTNRRYPEFGRRQRGRPERGRVGSPNRGQTPEEAFAAEREVHIAGVDLGALSAGKGKPFAPAFLNGVRNARETARWRVSQLHQIPLVAKNPHVPDRASALSQLRQSYDDLAARNRTLLTQQGGVR
jgi:hypothetical protein